MSTLYIVATPIGNLEDITLRALKILKQADIVLAEDKRVTKKLFDRHGIKTTMDVWHQHSGPKDWLRVKKYFESGKDVCLVTDAGTPGVSDPGGRLVEYVVAELPQTNIVPIPGSSTLAAIISISGIAMDRFLFLGFLPHKKGRQTIIEDIKSSSMPVIFFESVHRISKTLEALTSCQKNLIVGRELTKQFETIYRGTAKQILDRLNNEKQIKGEFVVIVGK